MHRNQWPKCVTWTEPNTKECRLTKLHLTAARQYYIVAKIPGCYWISLTYRNWSKYFSPLHWCNCTTQAKAYLQWQTFSWSSSRFVRQSAFEKMETAVGCWSRVNPWSSVPSTIIPFFDLGFSFSSSFHYLTARLTNNNNKKTKQNQKKTISCPPYNSPKVS